MKKANYLWKHGLFYVICILFFNHINVNAQNYHYSNSKKYIKTELWDSTKSDIDKYYIDIVYLRKNGNLESHKIKINEEFVDKVNIHGFGLGFDWFDSYIFLDSTMNKPLFYYDKYHEIFSLSVNNFGSKVTYNTKPSLYMNIGLNLDYSRGYGWKLDSNSSFSFFNSLGLGAEILSDPNTDINNSNSNSYFIFSDFFSSGIRYQINESYAINMSLNEHLNYFSLDEESFLYSKIIEVGSHAVLDKFITPILINNKIEYTPIIQFAYQTGLSYLIYSLRKNQAYFPFENKLEKDFITDTRFRLEFSIMMNKYTR